MPWPVAGDTIIASTNDRWQVAGYQWQVTASVYQVTLSCMFSGRWHHHKWDLTPLQLAGRWHHYEWLVTLPTTNEMWHHQCVRCRHHTCLLARNTIINGISHITTRRWYTYQQQEGHILHIGLLVYTPCTDDIEQSSYSNVWRELGPLLHTKHMPSVGERAWGTLLYCDLWSMRHLQSSSISTTALKHMCICYYNTNMV